MDDDDGGCRSRWRFSLVPGLIPIGIDVECLRYDDEKLVGVLNPFIRLAAFSGSDGLIVAATPSKVSRRVFLDKDLAESDVPSVDSVIGPPFPAISPTCESYGGIQCRNG